MRYALVLHTDDGVRYGVTVPDLPGCFSAGDTLDEAVNNAEGAILSHLEWLVEEGDPIPSPRALAEHRLNPDYADGVFVVVDVDLTPFLGKAEKINITLPRLLIHKIDQYVATHKNYGSRSGFLAKAAQKELGLT